MIDSMEANYGGTMLEGPLNQAFDILKRTNKKNARLFVLTDGFVTDREKVFAMMPKVPNNVKLSTFGIGEEFDRELVMEVASKGHGHPTCISDLKNTSLSAAVVKALGFSMNPSL
jgi:hypothetical protein